MGNQPSPLRQAIRWNEYEKVERLLDKAGPKAAQLINSDYSPDCILQACTKVDGNAFYYAVSKAKIRIIKLLLERGADPYATGVYEESCLNLAARNNYLNIGKILVETGVDVKVTDNHGRHPIHAACMSYFDTSQFIRYLLDEVGKREDVNLRDFHQSTPLHEAALFGNIQIIKTLLEYRADVNAADSNGNTPLHFASRKHGPWVLLTEKGADPEVQNNRGQTPSQLNGS